MQCPKCDHQDTEAAFGDPAKCPSCGVYYAKALAHKQRMDAAAAFQPELVEQPQPDPQKVEPVIPEPVQSQAAPMPKHLIKMTSGSYGAQPVVVTDIHMSFNSMVWFMVKWAIASIPAVIILVFIASLVYVLGVAGFTWFSDVSTSEAPPKAEPAADEVIYNPNPGGIGKFWLMATDRTGDYEIGTVRFILPGESETFSVFTVNCATAMGAISRLGPNLREMQPTGESFAAIEPGSRRHYVAMRLCRDRPDRHENYQ